MSAKFRKSPIRKLSLKSGTPPKICIETTENIFPDTKNAFLAALEDTKLNALGILGGVSLLTKFRQEINSKDEVF